MHNKNNGFLSNIIHVYLHYDHPDQDLLLLLIHRCPLYLFFLWRQFYDIHRYIGQVAPALIRMWTEVEEISLDRKIVCQNTPEHILKDIQQHKSTVLMKGTDFYIKEIFFQSRFKEIVTYFHCLSRSSYILLYVIVIMTIKMRSKTTLTKNWYTAHIGTAADFK